MSGSGALWDIGEVFGGLIPAPPRGPIAALLSAWWERERTIGCKGARRGRWYVVAPSVEAWCLGCGLRRFRAEHRCAFCHGELDGPGEVMVFESGAVTFLMSGHEQCTEGEHAMTKPRRPRIIVEPVTPATRR